MIIDLQPVDRFNVPTVEVDSLSDLESERSNTI